MLPLTGLPSGFSRVKMPPTIPAAWSTPRIAFTLSSVSWGMVPLPSPMTIRSVLPQAESMSSSKVERIVPVSRSTPKTIPTPSTTPKHVSADRSGRVRSWRNAIELKERSIASF